MCAGCSLIGQHLPYSGYSMGPSTKVLWVLYALQYSGYSGYSMGPRIPGHSGYSGMRGPHLARRIERRHVQRTRRRLRQRELALEVPAVLYNTRHGAHELSASEYRVRTA